MAATTYTLTAPTPNVGFSGQASLNFTVQLDGTPALAVTITPADGLAGSFSPATLVISDALAHTFTYTPAAPGFVTISATNDSGLTDPASVPYVSNPDTLALIPALLPLQHVTLVTFVGQGTNWLGSAPTFTPAGVAGVTVGAVTVLSNEQATALVTTLNTRGTASFTDSTTGAVALVPVGRKDGMAVNYMGPTAKPRVRMPNFRSLKRG